jgi:hypothetical protein
MDIQFAAKEVSRFMSKPEEQDWSSAKRLARYLKDNKRGDRVQVPEAAGKIDRVVRRGFCRMLEDEALDIRRRSHVRLALH